MAAAFAALRCKVLWRLTPKEVPDAAAVAALALGNNTQVLDQRTTVNGLSWSYSVSRRSSSILMVIIASGASMTEDCCLVVQETASACCSVQVLTWVPQNDILAHPNLRAFLSHVGINSMYEVSPALLLQTSHEKRTVLVAGLSSNLPPA